MSALIAAEISKLVCRKAELELELELVDKELDRATARATFHHDMKTGTRHHSCRHPARVQSDE